MPRIQMMLALAMVTLVEPYLSGANSTGRDGFLWLSASGYGCNPASHRIGWWAIFSRKALYLMVKTMVSCRFSLEPIQWASQDAWQTKFVTALLTDFMSIRGSRAACGLFVHCSQLLALLPSLLGQVFSRGTETDKHLQYIHWSWHMLMFVMWPPIQVTNMRCTPTTVLSPVLCSPCLMLGLSWDPAFQSANRMESVKIGWIMDNHGRSWINEVPWSWDLSISFHYETWLRHNSTWCPTRCWGWDLPHSP